MTHWLREAVSHSKGRESPLGAEREREFPATKVGTGDEHISNIIKIICNSYFLKLI